MSPCSLATNPDPELFFFERCDFSVIHVGTSTIRAASRCRIRLSCIDADVLRQLDGCRHSVTAVVHPCRAQVIASSGSLTLST